MLTAQFRILLWPRPTAKGDFPVKCCVAFKGKRRYYSTGFTCNKIDWESSNARFRNKNRAKDNEILNSLDTRAEKILRDWIKDNIQFSFAEFEKQMFSNLQSRPIPTIVQLLNESSEEHERNKKISSADTRKAVAVLLDRLIPNETPATVRPEQIAKVLAALKDAGFSQNTIYTYMAVLCAELRPYAKRGITSFEVMDAAKVPIGKAPKHAIHREEMRMFENYQARTLRQQFYIDMFVFCFYVRGINMADIARLQKHSLQGTTLSYRRQKTDAQLRIQLLPPAMRIVEKYRTEESEYLFPILSPGMTERQIVTRIGTVAGNINKTIRKASQEMGLPERQRPISFYTARHTYATTLKRMGVDINVISELIGHSDVSVTRTYLDYFEEDTLSKADQLLL